MSQASNTLFNKTVVAKLLGTFALVFIGAGSVLVESHTACLTWVCQTGRA